MARLLETVSGETDETLQRYVKTVKDAAERTGRDPDSVTVWSCFATIGDHLAEPARLKKTVGRLATYLARPVVQLPNRHR